MSKPNTPEAFSRALDQDRVWRALELSDLHTALQRADKASQSVLLRALVTITYAHWEGFVKGAAQLYLEYVARRKLPFDQLERQYLKNHFLPRLDALSQQKIGFEAKCQLIDEILDGGVGRFKRVPADFIHTENLNSQVMATICQVCGVDATHFSNNSNYIDLILLKRRNSIAHGENSFVALEEAELITGTGLDLMMAFKNLIENAVWESKYLR